MTTHTTESKEGKIEKTNVCTAPNNWEGADGRYGEGVHNYGCDHPGWA